MIKLTLSPDISAKCVVLFPGEAHISRTCSCGCASTTQPHTIDGRFCRTTTPLGHSVSLTIGSLDAGSRVWTPIPLKQVNTELRGLKNESDDECITKKYCTSPYDDLFASFHHLALLSLFNRWRYY